MTIIGAGPSPSVPPCAPAGTRRWRRLVRAACALTAGVWLGGCGALSLDDVAQDAPVFDFERYFEGPVRASGWFSNRSGEPKRHFCGDFVGTPDGEDFVLDEVLTYTDGIVEERQWRVTVDEDGRFTATGDALVGPVDGQLRGNALRMRYTMNVMVAEGEEYELDFNDFMLLQPDGSLHNITQVMKFGVRLGTVTTQYAPHDGSGTCAARASALSG